MKLTNTKSLLFKKDEAFKQEYTAIYMTGQEMHERWLTGSRSGRMPL